MRFKGTAALFLAFIVLGGYVYFMEFRGKENKQKQEQAKINVFTVEEKDITEVSLIFPDRTITGVKKAEKQWEITSPTGLEADSDEWEQLASNVPKIEREDTVAQNVQDLAQFGLKDPAVKVAAKTKDGKTLEILFGAENPKKLTTTRNCPPEMMFFSVPATGPKRLRKMFPICATRRSWSLRPTTSTT